VKKPIVPKLDIVTASSPYMPGAAQKKLIASTDIQIQKQ
jgi:hypothetical protein